MSRRTSDCYEGDVGSVESQVADSGARRTLTQVGSELVDARGVCGRLL